MIACCCGHCAGTRGVMTIASTTACRYLLFALSPVHTSNNVEATFDFVAKNGNNVERVLRWNFVLSTKSNGASTLLLVWTGLYSELSPDAQRVEAAYKVKHCVALTGRNTTGPPWSVGRPTVHAPGACRPARRQRYRRQRQTTTDASQQNNIGPLGGPVTRCTVGQQTSPSASAASYYLHSHALLSGINCHAAVPPTCHPPCRLVHSSAARVSCLHAVAIVPGPPNAPVLFSSLSSAVVCNTAARLPPGARTVGGQHSTAGK